MNLLAHAYLSFHEPGILTGNMISDFVKGSARYTYPLHIQKGIQLHREIDQYTDDHAITKKAKEIFRPFYRLYSAPIMDIIYDHYLACDKNIFTNETLKKYSSEVYDILEKHSLYLPASFLSIFVYMKEQDWLFHYSSKNGIERSLHGLFRRASFIKDSTIAFSLFQEHYEFLNECYKTFFPDLIAFAKSRLQR